MKSKSELIREEQTLLLASAQRVLDGATGAGRSHPTAQEYKAIKTVLNRYDELQKERAALTPHGWSAEQMAKAKEADALMKRLESLGDPVNGDRERFPYGQGEWAKSTADLLRASAGGYGVKALLSGEVTTPPQVDVVTLPEVPRRLLDLIPRKELTTATYAYLRQVVRTNNAAAVADGAVKPQSVFTFVEIEGKAEVVAHMSEPIPSRFFGDHESIIEVLNNEMMSGVPAKIENLIVSGTGSSPQWEGILTATGTTAVGFSVDALTTLRKARTRLEGLGERVTAVAMNPGDVEALELLRVDSGAGGFLVDGSVYERIFGEGVKGVPATAVPAGTAILGDWSQVLLRVRQNTHTLAATQGSDANGNDLFERNLVRLRTEGRFSFDMLRPQALAVVNLAAAEAWDGTSAYVINDRVSVDGGELIATKAGTSGAVEPTIPALIGGTVTDDGTVNWRRIA